ncbi:hypothetical protein V6Z96_006196 [Aspergillus fumigatus]
MLRRRMRLELLRVGQRRLGLRNHRTVPVPRECVCRVLWESPGGLHGRGDACHGPHALLDCDARGADGCEDYAYEYEDDYDDDGADVYCDFGDEKRDCDCDCHCHCHCNRVKKHDHEGD